MEKHRAPGKEFRNKWYRSCDLGHGKAETEKYREHICSRRKLGLKVRRSPLHLAAVRSSVGFKVVLVVKNPPANEGDIRDAVQSVGQEDLLEEGMATHSSILENPMDRGAWRATVNGVPKSRIELKCLSTQVIHAHKRFSVADFLVRWGRGSLSSRLGQASQACILIKELGHYHKCKISYLFHYKWHGCPAGLSTSSLTSLDLWLSCLRNVGINRYYLLSR